MEVYVYKNPTSFSRWSVRKNDYVQYGIGECLIKTEFWSDTEETGGLQEWHVEKAIKILNGETNE